MKQSGWGFLWVVLALLASSLATAQNVSRPDLERDLAYVTDTLSEVHPAFAEDAPRRELELRAQELLRDLPDDVPRWRAGLTLAALLRTADDAHTSSDLTVGSARFLPLEFAWLSDGLVVAPVTGSKVDIPVASEVLRLGALSPEALQTRLSELISESRVWVRRMGAQSLPVEGVLRWLGVVENEAVTLTVRTPAGEVKTVEVGLTSYGRGASQALQQQLAEARGLSGGWQFMDDVTAWRVNADEDYGFFWLKQCAVTTEYQAAVIAFFREVADKQVNHVVISVQQNGGGNSGVTDELLNHLRADSVRSYSSVRLRYSPAVLERINMARAAVEEEVAAGLLKVEHRGGSLYRKDLSLRKVQQATAIFSGEVFSLTDAGSFSAAVDLATTLSDNRLATVVGEPTGGVPTSYGNALEFFTPNLELSFLVTYTLFVRPDPSRDPANSLTPDVPLPITVQDLQTGHSPVRAWLEHLSVHH